MENYTALYTKHRPRKFASIVGNVEVVESVSNLVTKKNPPHTYLLTGPTGCGKTTLARIMAKELNCLGTDFREINCADFRGIDTVRDIIKQSQFKPLEGINRMFMVDECHMLTKDAQNAFLKILEDPPSHVYFVLATTEPDKLLSTIVGRCSTFKMAPLSDKEMAVLLKRILKREKEEISEEIKEQIIQDSLGHPRNAIQILEQVLSVSPDKQLEIAKRKAEELSEHIALSRALCAKAPWKNIANILQTLKQSDAEAIRRNVLGYACAVLLKKPGDDHLGLILEEFKEPMYNSGFPGLVYACYSVTRNQ